MSVRLGSGCLSEDAKVDRKQRQHAASLGLVKVNASDGSIGAARQGSSCTASVVVVVVAAGAMVVRGAVRLALSNTGGRRRS